MVCYLSGKKHRSGMTLIELLVVIGIILAVIALGYLALPNYSDRKMAYAADRLQAWLLSAKMQAKREGKATGIRITWDPNNTSSSYKMSTNTLQYIQQPDDYVAYIPGTDANPVATPGTCSCSGTSVSFPSTAPLSPITGNPDVDAVAAGDYIAFQPSGLIYRIVSSPPVTTTSLSIFSQGPGITGGNYKILRGPRPLPGEEDLILPDQVLVNLSLTKNIQPRTVNGVSVYEILFSPAGNIVGSHTGSLTPIIRLTDTLDVGNPIKDLLVTVQIGSGLIMVNQVAPGSDPYLFTRDDRASGL